MCLIDGLFKAAPERILWAGQEPQAKPQAKRWAARCRDILISTLGDELAEWLLSPLSLARRVRGQVKRDSAFAHDGRGKLG